MEINFSQIRTHDGSKNSGFEELICQIAHLQKPDAGKRFVKKDGAGGDAGVECYWILEDGSEICWQAKYFLDGMNSSRWQQIDESFTTALEKHPKLTHYIVCLPLDKADSRKKGKGGKQVVSVEDEWLEHIEKWVRQAKAVDRQIEFSYWGKHEITTFLTIDDPRYSGRALYWFNEPFLGTEVFRNIAKRAQDSLGDRYTPEFHVELPIAKSFDGLCLNFSWWGLLKEKKSELKDASSNVISFLKAEDKKGNISVNSENINRLADHLNEFLDEFGKGIADKDFHNRMSKINSSLEVISKLYAEVYKDAHDKIDWSERKDNSRSSLYRLDGAIDDLASFVKQKKAISSQTKAALLYGEAGIGKSHLLCDLSLHRIDMKLPTLFLLGAQYQGGNPTDFIKASLDLQSYRTFQVLGAIDAAGERSGGRALIVIDAINEGNNRDDWHDQITGFLSDLSQFPHIAVLLSCRSTYLSYILPDSADEKLLPRIKHDGFSGHEHRAAEKFLSQQGISKPSAPMLAPEFTSPFFLKTCCRALRQNKQNSFPKGLDSITSLFDFYVSSIERVVAKKKRFNPNENIVKSTLTNIASKLLPDNLEGLLKQHVRKLVNNYDPNPNHGDSLFDILIDEGILSEDVSYKDEQRGNLIVRFTYERFSDYFIAQELVNRADNIEAAFLDGGSIGQLLKDNGYYRFSGIFEALAIIIAESFNRELEDLLPDDIEVEKQQLDETFQNTVLWRSPSSFSERTLEVLNNLEVYSYSHTVLDILLKLSTEPNHPWNAELLHRNLAKKEIAERDHFWSIHIARGDSSEEDESIIRTIIEWAHSGEIESVEEERIRLCAITLIWFLTTPNRRIRDRSTKSLVRILSSYPNLVEDLLNEFSNLEDTYLTERLYAVAYGVVCNTDKEDIIKGMASTTFKLIFRGGEPTPHILLRDYARGILEYALHIGVLPVEIAPEQFRPPYKSSQELDNPSKKEIEGIAGDEFTSSIKSSLMGFLGDFGNYTMGCVHNWSSTPISLPKIENGIEIKERFAHELLTGDVQEEYLAKLEQIPVSEELLRVIRNIEYDSEDCKRTLRKQRKEKFDNRVKAQLNDEQKEYYRWLSGISNDRPAAFSRKWAQRWVCKRAHEFGWTEELFVDFERMCSHGRVGGPSGGAMERVGKKYQWMAFHEFLARLSDNYHWINRGYSDVPDDDSYEGPWQIYKRDIDPTIWARESGEYKTHHNKQCTWWQPYSFPFPNENNPAAKTNFLWDEEVLPDFSELLQRAMPVDSSNWLVLHGFWSENRKYSDDDIESPYLDGWFRINSIFIRKGDYESLAKGKTLCDPHIVSAPSTQHEGFLGEYPWHTIYRHVSGWREPEEVFREQIAVEHLIPFSKYEWEYGNNDYSLNGPLYFHMPAKELIKDMDLVRPSGQWGRWEDKGQLVFFDPSLDEYGPSYALMRTDKLLKWLDDNDMEIVWLIGGEKQMFSSGASRFFGRLVYSGLFKYEDGKPVGSIWCNREEPTN